MYGGFSFLIAAGSLLYFRHAVFWFDFVAALLAEDAAFGGFRRWHRGVHGDFPFCFNNFFYFFDERLIPFRSESLFSFPQIISEARNRVTFFPEVEHFFWHISGGIVDSVTFHAHHFGFDHGWAFAAVGAFDGFAGGVVDLAGVGAIDDYAGDAVSDGAFGEVFAAILHVGRGGVGPEIALDEEHKPKILHGGEVDAFVGDAGGLAPVADVGHDGEVAALQARAQRHAGEHGN